MHGRHRLLPSCAWLIFCWTLLPVFSWSQSPTPQSRIVQGVNESALVTLRGNTHPLAQPQFDRGAAPPGLPMARMLLVLQRSAAQESALQKLLDDQQDTNSPGYHQWLTPDAFGQQFGPSDQDIQAVTTWLESHGFHVAQVGKGRTTIEFSGTALQVQQAFHTEIHKYLVNGQEHWANASDPQIPASLSPVVAGVNSLHNFPKQPMQRVAGVFSKSRATGEVKVQNPDFTLPDSYHCGASGYCYLVGPYDFAKIYNVQGLWNDSPAIDGTGQSIAIVAVSNINVQDVRDFRNLFGLPANDPQIILNGPDPGLVSGDETEADLDVEWSGAVATGATIKLVVTAPTNTGDGIDLSALYAVENNVAPVLSESYGECELFLGTSGNTFENAIRQQAAAEGITFINSSGDEGSARCDVYSGSTPDPATHGLTVSGLATSPHGVAVGGTDFANYGSVFKYGIPSPYWGVNNDSHQASVLGYVPETTWNSSCTNAAYVALGWGSTAEAVCNNSRLTGAVVSVGGGGGKSSCITSDGANGSSCAGGYSKPSWQAAPGVPADGARDIPDISLFASSGFMDSAYIVCEADRPSPHGSCGLTSLEYDFLGVGGTSASAPAFAGMMALVNQFTKSAGQGNANYVLYKLASLQSQRTSNCNASGTPASGCIFNDVTSGTIAMPCKNGSPNCTVSNGANSYGVLSGYNAGTGYDLATGLGSVNAYNLVHDWSLATFTPTTTSMVLNNGNPVSITHGQNVSVNVTVSSKAATGDVSLVGSPTGGNSIAMGGLTLQDGTVSGTTSLLAGGNSYQVKAHYAGDGIYAPSDSSPVTVTVAPEPSTTLITIPVFDPKTGIETANAPSSVVYGTVVGVRTDVGNNKAVSSFPPQSVCAPPACPTGSVAVTDSWNGSAATPLVAAGGFVLNSKGYSEDFGIMFPGGTHQIVANYPGDNSFSPSSGNYTLTVTPATAQLSSTFPTSDLNIVGNFVEFDCEVLAPSFSLAPPTGTISFYDGATLIPGAVTVETYTGLPNIITSGIRGQMPGSFTAIGNHAITAKYSGDTNYAAATILIGNVLVKYPVTPSISVSSLDVNLGDTVTITVTVTSTYKTPILTGTFTFTGNPPIPGPVTPVLSTDANGNQVLTATVTTAPLPLDSVNAVYSGDDNYAGALTGTGFHVIIPEFSVISGSPSITINAGQTGTSKLSVTPLSNISSTVVLSCNLYVIAGANCAFTPVSQLNLVNGAAASTTLTITTLPPSSNTTAHIVAIRPQRKWQIPPLGWWIFGLADGLAILILYLGSHCIGRRLAATLSMICLLCLVVSCGSGSSSLGGNGSGGGNGGGGGSGGSGGGGPAPTSITLSTSSVKVQSGANVTLTANVTSANSLTGIVYFTDDGFTLATGSVVNGMATAQTSGLSVGTHVISAQYGGDSNNVPSKTNGSINQVITGTAQASIQGTTISLTHTILVDVTIQ